MRRVLTCGLSVLVLLGSGCRHHYRHDLRKGALSDVGATSLRLYFVESIPVLEIGNEAADGACLELDLRVTVDGVPQSVVFVGGRQLGGAKHPILPGDVTDSCAAARVSVRVPDDPRRPADVFEVDDGKTKLRAEFPNVLSSFVFTTAPPASVAPGDVIRASVLPGSAPAGSSVIYVSADLSFGPTKVIDVATRGISRNEFEMTIPPTSPRGPATLYVAGGEKAIPPMVCSAKACTAESSHLVEWKLVVR